MSDSSTQQTTMWDPAETETQKSSPSALEAMLQRPVMMYFDSEIETFDGDVVEFRHTNQDYILVGLIHSMGLILALVGNSSVIIIIARTKKLHTSSSLLVLVLAISDLLLSLFWNLVPLLLTFVQGVNLMLLESGAVCNVIGFAWQTLLTISTLSHSIVAFDRFLFIVHPMKYQVYVTIKATSVLTCIVIVIASLMSALTLISRSNFRFHHVAGMCIGSPTWSVLYLFLIFIPSLSMALFAYQRIWRLCVSIFKQEDNIASRGHSPHLSDSNQLPPLSRCSTRNQSRSDLSAIIDMGGLEHNTHQNEPETATQRNILTTVTTQHTTKVTRKNTTTTTTIANTTCQPELPVEIRHPLHEGVYQKTTVDRKVSEVTKVEVDERTSTSTERKRTLSVTFHTNGLVPISIDQVVQDELHIPSCSLARSATTVDSGLNKRSYSKDSLISFLTRKHRQCQNTNPSIITTSAESIRSMNTGDNSMLAADNSIPTADNCPVTISTPNTTHLNVIDPLPIIITPPQSASYETVTRKLFGGEAILPSLLYVAILMPLSMHKTSSSYKHRRRKACLLIGLPVLIMAVSFLPFPGSLIYLGYLHTQDSFVGGGGMFLIKLICHLTYALVPSLTSLLLCLNNKPYRRALRQTFRCRCL